MLHGGTQDADDFAAGTRMKFWLRSMDSSSPIRASARARILPFAGTGSAQGSSRGAGEPSIIAGITDEIVDEFDLDPQRVFVAGLSAGGAMAASDGSDLSGDLCRPRHSFRSALPVRHRRPSAFSAMRGDPGLQRLSAERKPGPRSDHALRVPTIVFHGDADRIVHSSNAAKIIEAKTGDTVERAKVRSSASRAYTRAVTRDKTGTVVVEQWLIHGSGHAWSGGSADGTYTDPHGPDASREMLRFFLEDLPSD